MRYMTGNLLASPAQALVNTVNTVGVMGKGMDDGDSPREGRYYALKYMKAFPDLVEAYPPREYSSPKDDVLKMLLLAMF